MRDNVDWIARIIQNITNLPECFMNIYGNHWVFQKIQHNGNPEHIKHFVDDSTFQERLITI